MGKISSSWDNMTKQEKIDAFNAQIDNTVIKHGEMLKNRRDLSIQEKNEMQAEITENANIAKAEFAEKMQAEVEAENNNDMKEATMEDSVSEGVNEGATEGIGNSSEGNSSAGNGSEGNGNSGGMGE